MELRVNKNLVQQHDNELLIFDYARGIFNREGKQVWTLPKIPGLVDIRKQVRDFKLTPDKSLTLISGNIPLEIDFEGNVLWQGPHPYFFKGDSVIFHHDLRKMPNGHYFVAGNRVVCRKVLTPVSAEQLKSEPAIVKVGDSTCKKVNMGLLMEFDATGNLVWYWDSNDYFTDKDLNHKIAENGVPPMSSHMNAFSVNEDYTKAYVGFRDVSRIVRIDIKTGKVDHSIGEKYPSGEARIGDGLIQGQHDATITKRRTILVFNNNNSKTTGLSSVLELHDKESIGPQVVWKFDLNFDTLTTAKSAAAGNVVELKNGDLLVCAGLLPRLFQVKKDKQVVWDAFMWSITESDSNLVYFPQYRIGYTDKLYHRHFLVNAKRIKKGPLFLELTNSGNVEDQYFCAIIDREDKVLSGKSSGVLKEGQIEKLSMPAPESGGPYRCRVTSKSNRFVSKTLELK